jgi:type II secretory pathway pseudopilin PulG
VKISPPKPQNPRGFLLLEVILALMVFAIAATSFAVALQKTANLAMVSQQGEKITRLLESALTAAMSMPTMEEGTNTVAIDEMSEVKMEIDTEIKLIPDLQNQDGALLQEMYSVTVSAHWLENNEWKQQDASTWRYGRLYQP